MQQYLEPIYVVYRRELGPVLALGGMRVSQQSPVTKQVRRNEFKC